MSNQILENLKTLLKSSNLASKKWIYEQYDSQVMNDTIQTKGDAAIVRVHGTKKALAITTDCTPRYVEADAFEGAKQAVAETYRNISAVGGTPLAITNCLNFGNPQKPEIMGQIVRAIRGINEACKALNYPVVSGNVSLYNETDGKAIQPTPAIGGVGLLKDYDKRCDTKFKKISDEIFVVGTAKGHLSCSLFEQEVQKNKSKTNPPIVDLREEKKNAEFIRELIHDNKINACHDISDGGLLVTLFEMCSKELGCDIDISDLQADTKLNDDQLFFGEDQSRYVVALDPSLVDWFERKAKESEIVIFRIGKVLQKNIKISISEISVSDLTCLNESVFKNLF